MAFQVEVPPGGEGRRFVYVSPSCEELNGIPADRVLADPAALYSLILPEYAEMVAVAEQAALEAMGPFFVEVPFRKPDGQIRWFQLTSAPRALPNGGTLWDGFQIDITERRETARRLQLALDTTRIGLWEFEINTGKLYWSKRTKELYGLAPDAHVDFEVYQAGIHPDDRDEVGADYQAALAAGGGDFSFEHRTLAPDGSSRWVLAHGRIIAEGGSPTLVVGTSIDITDRKLAEAKEHQNAERLKLALEAGRLAEVTFDIANNGVSHSPAFAELLGHSPDKALTLTELRDQYHPEDVDRVIAERAAILAGDEDFYEVEKRIVRPDGSIRWVAGRGRVTRDAGGKALSVTAVYLDITERKVAEQALRDLNETLEHRVTERTAERNRVWSMSRDLLAIMGFDGRLKAINPAWEKTLGRDLDTLLAMPFEEQVHPDDHPAVMAMMEVLLRGETVERFEDRLRHADGSWRWISWTLVPEGEVFYAVGRDVTAEKSAAAELENAQEALRQSQKMEAMGQLTGGVAHDFNNLLTPIIGSLDMLERKGVGGEREQRLIAAALQSADRAKTLVQRLLAFARRQPLQSSAVDIARLVTGMADLIASTSGPQIHVVVDAPDDLPPAKADPNQLEMALLNLGVNARDAMPDGGTLRITAAAERVRSGHRSRLKPGGYIRLSVADTGVGMDEETQRRAIEPFFSTKGIGKGTGLGLSMVHGLASQLGGALTIESRSGVGTNIELWLPQSQTPADSALAPADAGASTPTIGRALLVDDEELVRLSTADMLTELGYAVTEASSAEEALRLIEGGLAPDLLVTDHLMPGMNGADLAVALREKMPGVPVLIVSGYAESEGISSDLPRLTKPFRNADLAATLADLSRRL